MELLSRTRGLLFFHDYHSNLWHYVSHMSNRVSSSQVCTRSPTVTDSLTHHLTSVFIGPLLYHFADMKDEQSIELSYDEVREVMVKVGFEFIVSIFRS